ncbi:hypothetical protein PPYR_14506 [Photinus pyralis]|uniref:Proteasome alpha-type subunits domain-containing protein n=1 Tax=Photinus pyralis TaxID=7054 RepID=A0A5N4A5G3_PHOPY|nr:hypothetical protein PPYR_14506 [Photinus pyralis]
MFRNNYDHDVSIWSPEGRLYQVEFAMEAVKMGALSVGIKNANEAVLVSVKRSSTDLSVYQRKIVEIDPLVGISFSGLTADAKLLARFLRVECLSYRYGHDTCMPIERLAEVLGRKMHAATQMYNTRPYGVGILLAGWDPLGPHIYEFGPTGNFLDCKAMAIGGRCQSARTYLERNMNLFKECDRDEIIRHGVRALQSTLPRDTLLSNMNVAIGVVQQLNPFTILNDEVYDYINSIDGEEHRPDPGCGDRNI